MLTWMHSDESVFRVTYVRYVTSYHVRSILYPVCHLSGRDKTPVSMTPTKVGGRGLAFFFLVKKKLALHGTKR